MKTRTFPIILFLIAGLFLVSHSHDAHACSCIETTELEALERSSASFVGTPTKIESTHRYTNQVTFEIERSIKNIAGNTTEIMLTTPSHGPACGYRFENNTRYLVHTHEMENQKYLQTSLCSGNKNLGFSNIPLLTDDSILENYPKSMSLYPIILFLIIAGIVLGIAIGIIVYRKKKKSGSNNK